MLFSKTMLLLTYLSEKVLQISFPFRCSFIAVNLPGLITACYSSWHNDWSKTFLNHPFPFCWCQLSLISHSDQTAKSTAAPLSSVSLNFVSRWGQPVQTFSFHFSEWSIIDHWSCNHNYSLVPCGVVTNLNITQGKTVASETHTIGVWRKRNLR